MDADRLSIFQFFQIFPTEADAIRFVEAQRWPYGVACPHCEAGDILTCKNGKPID